MPIYECYAPLMQRAASQTIVREALHSAAAMVVSAQHHVAESSLSGRCRRGQR